MVKISEMVSGFNRDSNEQREHDPKHAQSMYQLEEMKEGEQNYFSNANINLTQQNESNDASLIVPEHHMREQRLKQRRMNELKSKGKKLKNGGDPDFEKMFGKDITRLIYQVALNVDLFALAIQERAIGTFFKDGVTQRIHLIVALHFLDVELGEREYFGEFPVLEIFCIKKLLLFFINYISSFINEIATIVD